MMGSQFLCGCNVMVMVKFVGLTMTVCSDPQRSCSPM